MAKRAATPAPSRRRDTVVDIIPATPQDELDVTENARALSTWMRNMGAFFVRAKAMEDDAVSFLATVQRITPPASAVEDAALQRTVQAARQRIKDAEDHWGIAQVVSRFHKRLTAARARTTEPLSKAQEIAQRLHNEYAEAERRRVEAEERRLREESERRQREERERELARLEAEAADAEAQSADLSPRERQFVNFVVTGVTPTDAAQYSGYKDPAVAGKRLMAAGKIQVALEAAEKAQAIRAQAQAVAEAPVSAMVPQVESQVLKVGTDRTTYSAEIVDERLFVEAVLGMKHGIPTDVLTVDTVKLNAYARNFKGIIDRWPGVRLVKKTTTL